MTIIILCCILIFLLGVLFGVKLAHNAVRRALQMEEEYARNAMEQDVYDTVKQVIEEDKKVSVESQDE